MRSSRIEKGIIFAILSSVFSSTATVVASIGTRDLSPLLFLSVTGLISSIILFLYSYARREGLTRKSIKKNARDILHVTVLRSFIGQSFLMVGISLTTGIVAIFFTKMEPYFVLIWNWILGRERIKRRHLVLLLIHLFGAFLLISGGVLTLGSNELGDLLIIIAVALLALSYIPGKRLSKSIGAINSNAMTTGTAALVMLPISIVVFGYFGESIHPIGWAYALTVALLFNVFALTLWYASLKTVKGWIVSALRAIGPLAAAPFAFFVFGQVLGAVQIIGASIIIATSYIISRENKK